MEYFGGNWTLTWALNSTTPEKDTTNTGILTGFEPGNVWCSDLPTMVLKYPKAYLEKKYFSACHHHAQFHKH